MSNMNFPFVVSPYYTGITLSVPPGKMIADLVLPRVPVGGREFKYQVINSGDFYILPDTQVGRKGIPNQVEFGATEEGSFVLDHGLQDLVPQADIDAARSNMHNWDPVAQATINTTRLVNKSREKRVADLIFNTASYTAANRLTLSGSDQWSDPTSDPIDAILAKFDGMLIRPNKGIFGRLGWSKFRLNPKVTSRLGSALYGNTPTTNAAAPPASLQAVADLLELDEIFVGEDWVNTAKKGQTPVMTRVWGKHAAFIHQEPVVSTTEGIATFGYTAEYGNRRTYTTPMAPGTLGVDGGQSVVVGESLREVLTAQDCGFLFSNIIA